MIPDYGNHLWNFALFCFDRRLDTFGYFVRHTIDCCVVGLSCGGWRLPVHTRGTVILVLLCSMPVVVGADAFAHAELACFGVGGSGP